MEFDLIVIGSGPAGEKGAAQAAYFGKKVALIEKEAVPGGAAVNTGTLPSKTLRETALYLSGFRQRGLHGVDMKLERQATLDDFLHAEARVISEERARIDANLEKHRVTRFHGEARFEDAHTVAVHAPDGQVKRLTGQFVLIATGSAPHRPPMFPFDHQRIYDSDEIVGVHMLPKKMAVVGGGVIGCEYACLFATLGTEVTLIESKGVLLPFLDGEFSTLLTQEMRALGVKLRMNAQVVSCTGDAPGGAALGLEGGEAWEGDLALICAGRQANTGSLNLARAGLLAGKRGQLDVDQHYATKIPHIYAAGDVIGFPALASTAMEQARVAVVHMFQLLYKNALAPVLPFGIYTIPEVSMAGETEESLTAKGVAYFTGHAEFRENARGRIIGERTGRLKLIFETATRKLLGVHVLGEGATELVHIGLTAILTHAHAELFIQMCFNYPTLSEAYKYATYDALRKVGG